MHPSLLPPSLPPSPPSLPLLQVTEGVGGDSGRGKELEELVKVLRERGGSLERLVTDKARVVSASLDFHNNVKNVSKSIIQCTFLDMVENGEL